MLKVVLTSFFFYYISRNRTGYHFAPFSTRLLYLYFIWNPKCSTVMAEWLSRWTSDQKVVGSTSITDDLIFLCHFFFFFFFFFLITVFMILFPS